MKKYENNPEKYIPLMLMMMMNSSVSSGIINNEYEEIQNMKTVNNEDVKIVVNKL